MKQRAGKLFRLNAGIDDMNMLEAPPPPHIHIHLLIGTVATCRNYENNCCTFGSMSCWFKHDDIHENVKNDNVNENVKNDDVNENENHEVVKKLFDMMESFSCRLVQIENNM